MLRTLCYAPASLLLLGSVFLGLGCSHCGVDTEGVAAKQFSASNKPASPICPEDHMLNGLNRCVPLAWMCPPDYYGAGADDGCDCGCGVPDSDCQKPHTQAWCHKLAQTFRVARCSDCPGS